MQSIAGTLQAGDQAGQNEPKVAGDLVSQLMIAKVAKQKGDTPAQTAALQRAMVAAQKSGLDSQRQHVEALIKHQKEVAKYIKEIDDLSQNNLTVDLYKQAVSDKDYKTADYLAAVIKNVNADVYKELMEWRNVNDSENKEALTAGKIGSDKDVQLGIHSLERADDYNAQSPEQFVRGQQVRGKELYAEERAVNANRYTRGGANPFLQSDDMATNNEVLGQQRTPSGQRFSPTDALKQSLAEEDKKDTPTRVQEVQDYVARMKAQGKSQEEINAGVANMYGASSKEDSTLDPTRVREAKAYEEWAKGQGYTQEKINEDIRRLYGAAPKETDPKDVPVDLSGLPAIARNAYTQVSGGQTGIQREADSKLMKEAMEADTESGDENWTQTKGVLGQLAFERAGEAEKKWVIGRDEMAATLIDLTNQLEIISLQTNFDTGILEGTWEQIQQKLGTTGDPRLAQFQTELLLAIQAYRQAISGAAFTEAEAKEYERLFPGLSRNMEVNRARITGITNNINTRQRAFYERYLGGKEHADFVIGKENNRQALTKDQTDRYIQGAIQRGKTREEAIEYLRNHSKYKLPEGY